MGIGRNMTVKTVTVVIGNFLKASINNTSFYFVLYNNSYLFYKIKNWRKYLYGKLLYTMWPSASGRRSL